MSDDLVKRLRNLVGQYIGDADIDDELQGAAARIETLEAALREIEDCAMSGSFFEEMARKALEGKDE